MSAKLTGSVWELDLPHTHAWVLMSLCDHAEHDGTKVFPGNGLTAWKTGFSVTTVKRVLRELRDEYELIETVEVGGGKKVAEWRIRVENFDAHRKEPLRKRGRPTSDSGERSGESKPQIKPGSGLQKNRGQDEEKPGSKNRGHSKPGLNSEKPGSHSRGHDDTEPSLEPSGSRRGADAPEENSEKGVPSSAKVEPEPHRANTYFAAFCRDMKRMDIPFDETERKSIPGNINKLILKEGVEPKEMWRIIALMVNAFGAGRVVSPQQAMREIRGTGHSRRPPNRSIAVIGATEDDYREEDYNFHV